MGLFDYSIVVAIGPYSKIKGYIRWKLQDEAFDPETFDKGYEPLGKCFYRPSYVPVVWIPRYPKTPREYATLAHECIHAVYHLFNWANLPMTGDTEEVFTHATAHLINAVLEK
jgi:hypothetical protein